MLIWNGLGYLVFVFVFGCSLIANLITNLIASSQAGNSLYWDQHQWIFGSSLLAAAVLSWFVGRHLATRKDKIYIDKETGKDVIIESYHALFFIKMHWWGPILTLVGIIVIVLDLVKSK